jgi:hypothetical protein
MRRCGEIVKTVSKGKEIIEIRKEREKGGEEGKRILKS